MCKRQDNISVIPMKEEPAATNNNKQTSSKRTFKVKAILKDQLTKNISNYHKPLHIDEVSVEKK